MGEKFAANPVTGTGSMNVPIAVSPGRGGFGPKLSLSYDSGAGNGLFGFGWHLSLPAISRKTDKGLPQYRDAQESDIFLLSGAEDLVPITGLNGTSDGDSDTVPGFTIFRYRPRIEGLFARIERWVSDNKNDDGTHWRSISKDNILTIYGRDGNSRIYDPDNPQRIFTWLISETRDDKGNAILYEYKAEDETGVDLSQVHEHNRNTCRAINRYLKRIKYGNTTPLLNDDGKRPQSLSNDLIEQTPWLFEAVFDYGEHKNQNTPIPDSTKEWQIRPDPFSSYRAGFEIRTYRRCQRVLMFHHFPEDGGYDGLVRSTDCTYSDDQPQEKSPAPVYTFLKQVTQTGYKLHEDGNGYHAKSMPPLTFTYSQPRVQDKVEEVTTAGLENLPVGLDGTTYQWTDLHGEGLPGILTEQADAWYYKRNVSPIPTQLPDGGEYVTAQFAPLETVNLKPNLALAAGVQFMDLAGDGLPDLVVLDGPVTGFFEHDAEENWKNFRPFISRLNRSSRDPNLKFVDLDGDGHADVLITEDEALVWHASLGEAGFSPARRTTQALDEEKGPRLVFADPEQTIYLADLSGDGLTDLVRIRNGEVCYWPNLGYCRFGAKVTMDNAPWFDHPDQFDQKRLRLADIDGSGTTDIIYLHSDGVHLYFNQSGNSWCSKQDLPVFPQVDNLSAITVVDLLGNGTACLVWSSPLPGHFGRQMGYVNLMGDQKPHLLIKTANNLGAETRVHYAPSTKFYLMDKQRGVPWITKLPFPVHVVEKMETFDWISRNRFVTRYAYHHGYFDGEEREFRGFAMVEQWDGEAMAAISNNNGLFTPVNEKAEFSLPEVYTKTWFHTGVPGDQGLISQSLAGEYDGAPPKSDPDYGKNFQTFITEQLLPDTVLPQDLSVAEIREACRSLKGSMLRQEIYALDGSDKEAHPYSIMEQNFTICSLQDRGTNRHAIFFTHPREAITFHHERNPDDPRIQHAMTLAVDEYGNILKEATIGYGRSMDAPDEQKLIHITCTENSFTTAITDEIGVYRTPLPAESRTYEMRKAEQEKSPNGKFRPYGFEEMRSYVAQAGAGHHDIAYQDIHFSQAQETDTYFRRPIEHVRTLYRDNELTGPLPLGELESLALPYESYKLAFTDELLNTVFQRPHPGEQDEPLLPDDPADALSIANPGEAISGHGGYVKLSFNADDQNRWWVPSGQVFFSSGENDTPQAELGAARHNFFTPRRYLDPFGHSTTVTFDPHCLLMQETCDALGNTVLAENDYRVLQPSGMTDPNGNRNAVVFDTLGMVAGTAVMGKIDDQDRSESGDSLLDFVSDPTVGQLTAMMEAPTERSGELLKQATTRIVYDLDRFHKTQSQYPQDPSQWYPVFAATIARETHVRDLQDGQETALQISFSYSDGFGREIQKKIQAEPGPLDLNDPNSPHAEPRWVGSGWTVFNNKGKPVRQYEPFFDDSHEFKFGNKVGVSPILFYDPLGRIVATLHPNHTWEKVRFDPWQQTTWDVNDTCAVYNPQAVVPHDTRTDPDIGGYVDEYFKTQPSGWLSWYEQRIEGALGTAEQTAARKAAHHADTPTTAHFDSLGRPFLTIARNRVVCPGHSLNGNEDELETRIELDIEGNQQSVTDAKGRVVMRYKYDMLGTVIHQVSMEAGARWMLNDVRSKPIHSWDSRNFSHRMTYDALRRPREHYVKGAEGTEQLVGKTLYGDTPGALPAPEQSNHRGQAYKVYDNAGLVTSEAYDFKGNLLSSSIQLRQDYKATADWPQNPETEEDKLEQEVFCSRSWYDALNRPVQLIAPHSNPPGTKFDIIRPGYNEANLLERVDVWPQQKEAPEDLLDPDSAPLQAVSNIDYDAKGQRQQIAYGNGTKTSYSYDPQSYRLTRLLTTRTAGGNGLIANIFSSPNCLQDLRYTYDPAGNISRIEDASLKTTFHSGKIDPAFNYTYDALYRLIEAMGREQIGQSATPVEKSNTRDYPFAGSCPQSSNPQALRAYTERYVYDAVGNFINFIHKADAGDWQRDYHYEAANLLAEETGVSNRLTTTVLHPNGNQPVVEPYSYDAHGNMTAMPHLSLMAWDFHDQLCASSKQVVNNGGTPETTWYVYDSGGHRVRKVTENYADAGSDPTKKNERIYLGGFELYREYAGDGNDLTLERATLHLMDDKQRIGLVETKMVDTNSNEGLGVPLVRYQLANHLGSASLELDRDGGLISYEEYHPYGTTAFQLHKGEVSLKRYRYTGMERDEETGLNYHSARYYALWSGRWCSCDPAGLVDGVNIYMYAKNSPLLLIDPLGQQSLEELENGPPPGGYSMFTPLNEGAPDDIALPIGEGRELPHYSPPHTPSPQSDAKSTSTNTTDVIIRPDNQRNPPHSCDWIAPGEKIPVCHFLIDNPTAGKLYEAFQVIGSVLLLRQDLKSLSGSFRNRKGEFHTYSETVTTKTRQAPSKPKSVELYKSTLRGPTPPHSDADTVFFKDRGDRRMTIMRQRHNEITFDTEIGPGDMGLAHYVARKSGGNIYLGSGTHGTPAGGVSWIIPRLRHLPFFEQDRDLFQGTRRGIITRVYDVHEDVERQRFFKKIEDSRNAFEGQITVIRGWCWSTYTKDF
ncbi:SpvB/TcaC N-terminal domain-containing protein [uncultured Desulfobacter sp.]|uniref:SpvB/TcaC N-terminal domain-containing protein n=1 Tax=uncultured Desulfobacter sp. TaxID=240139 RepID=UPI002AAB3687|nr:SpvB/TcaC N-terminal domain-containing protein [uncultured Desulfobacter sp.]